jgi:hypothetical protein
MFLFKIPSEKKGNDTYCVSFLASVVSFLCFCPWNEQWKSELIANNFV